VLEEMHEEAVAPFDLDTWITIDPHDAVKEIWRQAVTDRDQALVDSRLMTFQFGKRRTWNAVLPRGQPEQSPSSVST
jgi:hypothetical protein